ncbi:MAG: GNAT family N-acetyltransferase [Fidelibacterota bacterium]
MSVEIQIVKTATELKQAHQIRIQVFVEEQKVDPSIELDEYDAVATHVLALVNGNPVGTARWRQTDQGIKLERFAVLQEYRGLGVGKALVEFILNRVRNEGSIYLNAQEAVIQFYEQFGFQVRGKHFFEAGIPHKKMVFIPGERE